MSTGLDARMAAFRSRWGMPELKPAWRERLLGLGLGSGLGLLLALGLWGEAWLEIWSLRQELAQTPASAAPPPALASSAQARSEMRLHGPDLDECDAAWLGLQQRLQAHGLHVQLLQTEALQMGEVLASQRAHLRVLGAWVDWLAFSQQSASHAPWWDWEQWQLQPAGPVGQVQLEARLRLWMRAARAPMSAREGPLWPVLARESAGSALSSAPLWAAQEEPRLRTRAPAEAPADVPAASPDWRLWGVWTQAGQTRVVLGRGADWTLLAPGQRFGPEPYRLARIGAEGVYLQGQGTRREAALFLPWQGEKP